MHDEKKKVDLSDICRIEEEFISALKTVMAHGIFSKDVNKDELSDLVDMVKDMAETKRNCWEACYYETVTEAMKKGEEEEQFRERRKDYGSECIPTHMIRKHIAGYNNPFNPVMDYYPDQSMIGWRSGKDHDLDDEDEYDRPRKNGKHRNQYGDAFGEYEDARRHYTETKSLEDKHHMDEKAMEHVEQSMVTLRDIWKNADPAVRKEVSSAITSLASEFKSM